MTALPAAAVTVLDQRWKVAVEDLVGGWCLMPEAEPRTPAEGGRPFADFYAEAVAAHVVRLHNEELARRAAPVSLEPAKWAEDPRNLAEPC